MTCAKRRVINYVSQKRQTYSEDFKVSESTFYVNLTADSKLWHLKAEEERLKCYKIQYAYQNLGFSVNLFIFDIILSRNSKLWDLVEERKEGDNKISRNTSCMSKFKAFRTFKFIFDIILIPKSELWQLGKLAGGTTNFQEITGIHNKM